MKTADALLREAGVRPAPALVWKSLRLAGDRQKSRCVFVGGQLVAHYYRSDEGYFVVNEWEPAKYRLRGQWIVLDSKTAHREAKHIGERRA